MDFTYLNKVCLKDAYPLPSTNKLIDAASEAKFLSFMDTYSSYNQIKIHLPDDEKTTFITENANYYYKVMPLGLKKARVAYQRPMNKVLSIKWGEPWKLMWMTWSPRP